MRKAIFYSLFILALAWPATGQSNYGEISGSVRDAQHLPIVGAAVQLTASDTRAVRRIVTNADGNFEASALLPRIVS
jgi:Carboxypeptidase regulatory-like domain